MARHKVEISGVNTANIKVLSNDRVTQSLLKNMLRLLKELSLKYKENIEIQ